MKRGKGTTLTLGSKIRMARIEKNLTGKALAEKVGVSPSLLSKVENDVASPSLAVLRRIAAELQVSVGDLADADLEPQTFSSRTGKHGRVSVVRVHERRILHLPDPPYSYQLLTRSLQGLAEFVWVELEPGQGGSDLIHHERGEEYSLVLEGTLHVYVQDEVYVLLKGDCIVFDARLPHCYKNQGQEKAVWVYAAVPPSL